MSSLLEKERVTEVSMDDIIKKNIILNIDDFMIGNKDIIKILDKEVYLMEVPVTKSYEAIMAFPNGYFNGDLNPFENYFLCKVLEEEFSYALFGIGASTLAFYREKTLDKVLSERLLKMLTDMYGTSHRSVFEKVLNSRKLLVLKYINQ
jgi:hypothetical protein